MVPCARFLATMQNGPVAVPLIEKLFLLVVLEFDGREGREEPTMLN